MIKQKISRKQTRIEKIVNFMVSQCSSSNLKVTISRVSISVLKGRAKRKIRPTQGLSCFRKPIIFSFLLLFLFLNGPRRTVVCSLYFQQPHII